MTFQFCMMQGQSSKLPVSNSRSWNSQSSNWQPSRLCDGFTSSVADSHCGSNSNNSDSLILQFRQCSSLFSLIRLPRVTSRASPFWFSFHSQSDGRNSKVCVSSAVGAAERSCRAVNSSQRSASDLLRSARGSCAARHITSSCC